MEITNIKDSLLEFYKDWNQIVIYSILPIILAIPFIFLVRKLIGFLFTNLSQKYGQNYLKLDEKYHTSRYLFHSVLVLYLILCVNLLNLEQTLPTHITKVTSIGIFIYGSFSFTALILSVINIFAHIYKDYFLDKHFPIHFPVQILKIFILSLVLIVTVSRILHISPVSIITSLGAATAFLTFVFRDMLSGLIASLQLIFQNKIQIGDQVNVPQYNISGEVETITITEVRVRANNGSIIIIPPSHLLTASITNLRDLKKVRPRKISRVIYLDINSVVFYSESMLNQLKQLACSVDIIKEHLSAVSSLGGITNLAVFKLYANIYLKEYLSSHKQPLNFSVNESSLLGLVSIEIIISLDRIEWAQYEQLSSEIFAHLIAVLPEFQIKVSPK